MQNVGESRRTSIHQTYFVFVPLFSKPVLTRQNIVSKKNSQEFLALQVSVLKRNKATNFSTSNLPVFTSLHLYLVIYSSFLDLTSHSHGKFATWGKRWKIMTIVLFFSLSTACANVMANQTSLNKLPNTRVSVTAENGSVEVLELVALFLLKTGTFGAKNW